MTFSYAKRSAEEQKRIALSMQPFYEQERANRNYEEFLARSEGEELGLLAAAISPDGAFGQAAKQFQTRRELTNLANAAEAELRSDTGSHRIIPLDELKERSESLEASYKLSGKLSADGADPETVAAIREATGITKINLATAYLKNLIPQHDAFLADKLATDERWIQLDNGDKFQINAYKSPSQFKAAVRQLTHEFNQNNGVYGLKPAFLAETGYLTGYEKNEANAIAAHGKTWKKDSENKAVKDIWEYNLNQIEINPKLFNVNPLLQAIRATTKSNGEKLSNKEAIDELFKMVEDHAGLDHGAAQNIVELLGEIKYDGPGGQVDFSKKRVDALQDKLDAKLSGDIDREVTDKERDRLLLTRDYEQGLIDDEEYRTAWNQGGHPGGDPPGILARRDNERITAGEQLTQLKAEYSSPNGITTNRDEVHPDNLTWYDENKPKSDKVAKAKNSRRYTNHTKERGIIYQIIGTGIKLDGYGNFKDDLAIDIWDNALEHYDQELQFLLDPDGGGYTNANDAMAEALRRIREELGDPTGIEDLKKTIFYPQPFNTKDKSKVIPIPHNQSRIRREVANRDLPKFLSANTTLDWSKPWTGDNIPNLDFLKELHEADRLEIELVANHKSPGTDNILGSLYRQYYSVRKNEKKVNRRQFAKRLSEALGNKVDTSTTKQELDIEKVEEFLEKEYPTAAKQLKDCVINPSKGNAYQMQCEINKVKASEGLTLNSNELTFNVPKALLPSLIKE